jgi:hypothetical protein
MLGGLERRSWSTGLSTYKRCVHDQTASATPHLPKSAVAGEKATRRLRFQHPASTPNHSLLWQAKPSDTGAGVLLWNGLQMVTLRTKWQQSPGLHSLTAIRRPHRRPSADHATIFALWPQAGSAADASPLRRDSSTAWTVRALLCRCATEIHWSDICVRAGADRGFRAVMTAAATLQPAQCILKQVFWLVMRT